MTAEQMRQVDRVMVDELGITLIQMMENAGRHLADLTLARYAPTRVAVLAGPGGNGGGGMVAARHLANRGVDVEVVLAAPDRPDAVPDHQCQILERMGVPVHATGDHARPAADVMLAADVVLDALLGYALRGDPRDPAATLIHAANAAQAPILALDVPSGVEATTGRIGDPCIAADATLTLALPKVGLAQAPAQVGALFAADISVPPRIYRDLGIDVGVVFHDDQIVPVRLPAG